MEIQKATGVVLSSRPTGEADYITQIYTKEYGKRDFIFKGLRKSKKRSLTISEPGTIAKLVYYFHEDKNLHTVNEFQIYRHNADIRNNLSKILLLYFIIETVQKTCGLNDTNKLIFDLIVAGIDALPKTEYIEHLSVFFTIHLLRLHGILPNFTHCKICNRNDFREFIIDYVDFQLICKKCSRLNNAFFFDNRAKEYILQSLTKKFTYIDFSVFPKEDIQNLLFHLSLFIQNYFHVEIKSKELLFSELSH